MTNPTIFWTLLRSNAYEFAQNLCFSCQGKSRDIVYQRIWLIFEVNIRPARTFWDSTYCLLSPFTLDWSRNLRHKPMWNMVVNNISYPIYPLSTRTEKGYITKMIPFFFCSVYFDGWVSFRVTVYCVQSRGARLVICKLLWHLYGLRMFNLCMWRHLP